MKWREPWKASIGIGASWPQFWRRFLRGFFIWYGVFAVMVVLYWLLGAVPPEALLDRLVLIIPFATGLSLLVYVAWLLSPRQVRSGPRGIVGAKSDESVLIPWSAIANFRLSNTIQPATLHLTLHSGSAYKLVLSSKVRPTDISNEIVEMTGAQV